VSKKPSKEVYEKEITPLVHQRLRFITRLCLSSRLDLSFSLLGRLCEGTPHRCLGQMIQMMHMEKLEKERRPSNHQEFIEIL